jgi:hypothetical protein
MFVTWARLHLIGLSFEGVKSNIESTSWCLGRWQTIFSTHSSASQCHRTSFPRYLWPLWQNLIDVVVNLTAWGIFLRLFFGFGSEESIEGFFNVLVQFLTRVLWKLIASTFVIDTHHNSVVILSAASSF